MCDKAASLYSGALYHGTQCGLNGALRPSGKSNNSVSAGLLSYTVGIQPLDGGSFFDR